MRKRFVLMLALALAAPALAGCIGGSDDPNDDIKKSGTDKVADKVPTNIAYPDAVVRTPLTTALGGGAQWVRPGEQVTLTAQAPPEAKGDLTYVWEIGRLPDGWGEQGSGDHAGHGGDAGGHQHGGGDGTTESIDTGEIQAGAAAALDFAAEGEYLFHCHPHPFMKFNLKVIEGAPTTPAHVAILDGENLEDYRYAPQELVVGPGTPITFWNNGTLMHTTTEEKREPVLRPILDATGASLTYGQDVDGDFRIRVTVTDSETGHGTSEIRLLVDPAKPDAQKTFNPMTGSFMGAFNGESQPEGNKHAFILDYKATTLKATFKTSSDTPIPASVKVDLVPKDGSPIGSESGESGEITATDLSSGQYAIMVTGVQGLQFNYEVIVTADLELVPPAPGADNHGGGGGHNH